MNMKKRIFLIPLLGLLLSCTGTKNSTTQDVSQMQTEAIEKSIQKLDNTVNSSKAEINALQSEIDGILNEL